MRENNQVINPKGHATDMFTDWTLEYLREQNKQEKPFFLFLTYNAPHDPVQPPQEWLSKIQNKEQNSTLKRQKMIAFVEHLDYNVGRILDQLNNSDLGENTIVVFTSDNGGALQYGASNNPFTGGKGDFFEGGIRVPCIVKIPSSSQIKQSEEPLLLMDFHPSLIKMAGGKIDENLPSELIVDLFDLPRNNTSRNMIWMRREGHKFGGRIYYAISDGRYKLLQRNPFSGYELFDLINDPNETSPIKLPKVKMALKKALTKHIQTSGKIQWQ